MKVARQLSLYIVILEIVLIILSFLSPEYCKNTALLASCLLYLAINSTLIMLCIPECKLGVSLKLKVFLMKLIISSTFIFRYYSYFKFNVYVFGLALFISGLYSILCDVAVTYSCDVYPTSIFLSMIISISVYCYIACSRNVSLLS